MDEDEQSDDFVMRLADDPFELMKDVALYGKDILLGQLNQLGPVAKLKENLMSREQFLELMRMANKKQLRLIHYITSPREEPLQLFFTGAAGSGKTFVIKLLMVIYNRFKDQENE